MRTLPLKTPWPHGTDEARALVERAAQFDPDVPPSVRASVRAALDRPSRARAWLPLVAVAASAVTAAALVVGRLRPRSPVEESAPAIALADRVAGDWSRAGRRAIDLEGVGRIVLSDGARAELLSNGAAGTVVGLNEGALLARVEHRRPGAPFIVRTPGGDVRVVGTVLWVSVAGARHEQTVVAVASGVVEVLPTGGAPTRVAAGEVWPAATALRPAAMDLALLDAPRDAALSGRTEGGLGGAPSFAPQPVPARRCGGTGRQIDRCLERSARGDDLLAAEAALFDLGWRHLRAGRPAAALERWSTQRARFPSGALRSEADLSMIQAQLALGRTAPARRAIDRYLDEHRASLAEPELRYLRGRIAVRDGRCVAARADLDAAAASGEEPWASRARRDRAACRP